MPLDPRTLSDALFAGLWPPEDPPESEADAADRIAAAYAVYLGEATALAVGTTELLRAALATRLVAHNHDAPGFLGAFADAWMTVPPATLITGAAAVASEPGFSTAAAPLLAAAMTTVQIGGSQRDFADGLALSLHTGTLAIVWTNASGTTATVQ